MRRVEWHWEEAAGSRQAEGKILEVCSLGPLQSGEKGSLSILKVAHSPHGPCSSKYLLVFS